MHTTYNSVIFKNPDFRAIRKIGMHLGAFCLQGENGKKTSVVIITKTRGVFFILLFNFILFYVNF